MEALKSALEMLTGQQERFNAIIKDKDRLIEQQQGLINEYKAALEEANQKLKNLEFKVSENDRKISGMQKTIDNEIRRRKLAEHNICFVDDCKSREPKLGTYKPK
jgi:chromosome segregation ATPase